MRNLALLAVLFGVATAVPAQEDSAGRYANKELGIVFPGVYGWTAEFHGGSGAWTMLATYSYAPYDAHVFIEVRDNPYGGVAQLRTVMQEQFKEGGEATEDKDAYADVVLKDADMKRGAKLPGVQLEATVTRITAEGKKRTAFTLLRVWFGANRLFRVRCEVRKSRIKKVRDLFDRALNGFSVVTAQEKIIRGAPLRSAKGGYACIVPEGFTIVTPGKKWKSDMVFENRKAGVTITVYSYAFRGILADAVDQMLDHYGDDIKMENEEAKVLGATGFVGTVTKGERVTLIVGALKKDRLFRIHTGTSKGQLEDAKRLHDVFVKSFKAGG